MSVTKSRGSQKFRDGPTSCSKHLQYLLWFLVDKYGLLRVCQVDGSAGSRGGSEVLNLNIFGILISAFLCINS